MKTSNFPNRKRERQIKAFNNLVRNGAPVDKKEKERYYAELAILDSRTGGCRPLTTRIHTKINRSSRGKRQS